MWFYTKNNIVIYGPVPLPKLWADEDGTKHPLVELVIKGHTNAVNSLGWLEQTIIGDSPIDYERITSYEHSIHGLQVDSIRIMDSNRIEQHSKMSIREISKAG